MPTAVDVVKFMIMNDDHIDHKQLTAQLVTHRTGLFFQALEKLIPGFETSMVLAEAAKLEPDIFMHFLERHVNITKGSAQIINGILANEKIAAIKKARELYGFGLLEAKHLIDALTDCKDAMEQGTPIATPNTAVYRAFKDANVAAAFWELIKVWKSIE